MPALADLTEEERFLLAILQDASGIDGAEFCWTDQTSNDMVFRCWDYQYEWYREKSKYQIDLCARAIGKSLGMQMRAWAFPFTHAGEEMLLTAPEMIHLDPVTKNVEDRIESVRLSREFLRKSGTSSGFTHRPFVATFRNGAKIVGRIPQKDGRGVKGSLAAGALVTTPIGHLPIEKISEGDLVLTHTGRFQPVLKVHTYEADTVLVGGAGHRGLQVSANHRFRGRRNSNPQRTRNLQTATWVPVDDEEMTKRWYWARPAAMELLPMPEIPGEDEALTLWVLGRYVADGSLMGTNKRGLRTGLSIVADLVRIDQVTAAIALAGYSPRRQPHSNAARVDIYSTELTHFAAREFGQHADGKRMPLWLHTAPQHLQDAFLDGYLNGDGHYNAERARWEISTASKELAIGLTMLGSAKGWTTSFSWVDPPPNAVCARPLRSFRVQWSERGNAVMAADNAWQRIRSVEPAGRATVYDLVVAEDYSYVADGIAHKGSRVTEDD